MVGVSADLNSFLSFLKMIKGDNYKMRESLKPRPQIISVLSNENKKWKTTSPIFVFWICEKMLIESELSHAFLRLTHFFNNCVCVCMIRQASWPAARERRKQSAFFRHEWGPAGESFLCGAIKTTHQWKVPTAPTFQTVPGTHAQARHNSPHRLKWTTD